MQKCNFPHLHLNLQEFFQKQYLHLSHINKFLGNIIYNF
jgi:hypothetical protein